MIPLAAAVSFAASDARPRIQRPLNIFVAGATGFVGRELVVRLARRGHQLRVATRAVSRADELLPLSSVEVAAGNVYSVDFLRGRLEGCDLAINLVGVLNPPGRAGAGFRRAHVEFTTTLLTAIGEAGVPRLLQMSALNADAERGRKPLSADQGRGRAAGAQRPATRLDGVPTLGDLRSRRLAYQPLLRACCDSVAAGCRWRAPARAFPRSMWPTSPRRSCAP